MKVFSIMASFAFMTANAQEAQEQCTLAGQDPVLNGDLQCCEGLVLCNPDGRGAICTDTCVVSSDYGGTQCISLCDNATVLKYEKKSGGYGLFSSCAGAKAIVSQVGDAYSLETASVYCASSARVKLCDVGSGSKKVTYECGFGEFTLDDKNAMIAEKPVAARGPGYEDDGCTELCNNATVTRFNRRLGWGTGHFATCDSELDVSNLVRDEYNWRYSVNSAVTQCASNGVLKSCSASYGRQELSFECTNGASTSTGAVVDVATTSPGSGYGPGYGGLDIDIVARGPGYAEQCTTVCENAAVGKFKRISGFASGYFTSCDGEEELVPFVQQPRYRYAFNVTSMTLECATATVKECNAGYGRKRYEWVCPSTSGRAIANIYAGYGGGGYPGLLMAAAPQGMVKAEMNFEVTGFDTNRLSKLLVERETAAIEARGPDYYGCVTVCEDATVSRVPRYFGFGRGDFASCPSATQNLLEFVEQKYRYRYNTNSENVVTMCETALIRECTVEYGRKRVSWTCADSNDAGDLVDFVQGQVSGPPGSGYPKYAPAELEQEMKEIVSDLRPTVFESEYQIYSSEVNSNTQLKAVDTSEKSSDTNLSFIAVASVLGLFAVGAVFLRNKAQKDSQDKLTMQLESSSSPISEQV